MLLLRSTQNSSCCNLWLSLCNCDDIQMHLLRSPHVGSKSGFPFPLDSSPGWNKYQIFLCIKHSHPFTVLMAFHSIYSSFSTSPLYKAVQMGPHKGEVTSLDLPVTSLLMQPSMQVSSSPHCTLPQLITWVRLTCFPLVHVRWSNLPAFGLKKRLDALLHNLLQKRKVCLCVTFTLPLFRRGLCNRKVPSEPWQDEEIICAHTSSRQKHWEAFWTVCQRPKIRKFANVNPTNYSAKHLL